MKGQSRVIRMGPVTENPTDARHRRFLLLAGVVAGAVGSAGGITSLVSYPALLAVGYPRCPRT